VRRWLIPLALLAAVMPAAARASLTRYSLAGRCVSLTAGGAPLYF
jgi:hypothetical protein